MYNSGEEPELPQIPGVLEEGAIGSELQYGTPLPRIPDYFEAGLISSEVPTSEQYPHQYAGEELPLRTPLYARGNALPYIGGLFEGGHTSEHTFRAEDQNLPTISGIFEQGRLPKSPDLDLTNSTERSALPRWSPSMQAGFDSPQVFDPFISQNLETSPNQLTGSRFQRFFGTSTTSSSPPPHSQSITQKPGIDFTRVSGSDVSPQLSSSFSNLELQDSNDWVNAILGNTSSIDSTQQGLLSGQPLPIADPIDFNTQSLQLSSVGLQLEDWAQNIFDPNISEELSQSEGSAPFNQQKTDTDEDIELMTKRGFTITSSVSNALFFGEFGPQIRGQTDIKGRPFTENDVGKPFFAKFVEFVGSNQMFDTKREMFETEKYILTVVEHHNIISIYQVFNMGQNKECRYRNNPNVTFTSSDRQYMILESADLGDLEQYLEEHILSEVLCINFIKQLYSGLKYLHDSSIFHCDIEVRNILLFRTNESDITVKWCDFNMSCILDGSHPSQPISVENERIVEYRRYDSESLSKIYHQILVFSNPSEDTSQLVELIIDVLQNANHLNEINEMIAALDTNY